jgi:hypothetical protein
MSQRSVRDRDFLNSEFSTMTLDEEDILFKDKRGTPRARPKSEKWVKVMTPDEKDTLFLKLYDLSQGGMGFIAVASQVFSKGDVIKIIGFEQFDLDDPLLAMVMSQRPVDQFQIEFKIGCKFLEGQN